jgi:hypothetical protein
MPSRRDTHFRPAVVREDAVSGAVRSGREGVAGRRPDPGGVGAEQAEDLLWQRDPGRLVAAGGVEDTGGVRDLSQCDYSFGDVACPGGLPELVVDDVDCLPQTLQPGHGAHEVVAVRAVVVRTTLPVPGRVLWTARSPASLVRP